MGVPAGPWHIDDLLTFTAVTHKVDTGVLTDADSVPSYRIYEDETGTAILTGSMAKLDDANTTGFYSEQITLSAANGFENGKSYAIYISATVNSIVGGQTFNFKVDVPDVNVVSMANNVMTAAALAADSGLKPFRNGTAQAGAASSITLDASASAVDQYYREDWVVITGGAGVGQARSIFSYNGTSKIATVANSWTTSPDNTSTFAILPFGRAPANVLMWSNSTVATPTVGGVPSVELIDISTAGMADIRTALGLASANIDTQLGLLASAASLATLTGYVDTEVAAIKAKTDSLTFTVAGQLDANIQYVNDVLVTGNGTVGTPWGP